MRAALAHLAERAGARRRLAVLGEMAELGADAPAYHREIGELVRELGVAGDRGRRARARLRRRVGRDRRPRRPTRLRAELRPGDVVLVKGSRSVGLEVVAENSID